MQRYKHHHRLHTRVLVEPNLTDDLNRPAPPGLGAADGTKAGCGERDEAEGVAWLLVVADEDRPALLQPGERALDHPAVGGVALAAVLVELLLADPADVRDP